MYKYYFHIIDRESGDTCEYDFEGYFFDHFEAANFIAQNERLGNTVIINPPYYEWVEPDELPPDEYTCWKESAA